jgi:hypothetical protein
MKLYGFGLGRYGKNNILRGTWTWANFFGAICSWRLLHNEKRCNPYIYRSFMLVNQENLMGNKWGELKKMWPKYHLWGTSRSERKNVETKLFLCLIKHFSMNIYGTVQVTPQALLTSTLHRSSFIPLFLSPLNLLDRTLVWPQNRSGICREEKINAPIANWSRFLSCSLA